MIKLMVNGKQHTYSGDPSMPILWYLRDELKLHGTKFGCGVSLCGACTIHLDGEAVRSCSTPLSMADGKHITTIEGLGEDGAHPVQQAWGEHNVSQCGFCQPGQIMQASSLLAHNNSPSDQEIITEMQGNVCRCGTYQRILPAIKTAAKNMEEEKGA